MYYAFESVLGQDHNLVFPSQLGTPMKDGNSTLVRYWKAYSDLPPPKELRKLLERLFCGEGLYLYAH